MWCITLVVLIIIITLIWLNIRRKIMLANQIKGPNGQFLIGSLSLLLQGPGKYIYNLLELYRKYEKSLFKIWICNQLYIIVTQPKDIEQVLHNTKLLRKSKEYLVLRESIVGQGIASIDDVRKWKLNRQIVSRGFNFTIIKSYIPIFYEEANVLKEILRKKCELESNGCDISIPVSMATMEMIGRTAIGVTFNAQLDGSHLFVKNLNIALHTWKYRFAHPWYLSKMLFQLSTEYKKHDQSKKIITKFIDKVIKDKIEEINQKMNVTNDLESEDIIGRKMKLVVEILLDNSHKMSYQQLRDELVTIIAGGQETTNMAISCAIVMLAHHQDVQNKVFEELESIFSVGYPDRPPTFEDLQKMEYLERVIKETLRLFPPVPLFARSLDEEMEIGDNLCPAGSTLIIWPLFLQTSPLYYTEPNKFNPDNFLPDMCHNRHPYAFIPFSAGYRNCIGVKYSMLQMKTVISTLVRTQRILPSDKCPLPNNIRFMSLATFEKKSKSNFIDWCYVKIVPRI